MTWQELGEKTYCLLQVPSQWTILHSSQVLLVSSSKCCCIVYTCICLLRFLWNNIFLIIVVIIIIIIIIYISSKWEKQKKKKKKLNFAECLSAVLSYSENIEEKKFDPVKKKLKKMFLFFAEINCHKGAKSWGTYSGKLRLTFQRFGTCSTIIMNKSFVLVKSVTIYTATMQCFQQAKRRCFQIIRPYKW